MDENVEKISEERRKELEFRAEQVELLYSNSLTGLVSTLVNGVIVAAVLWNVTPHDRLIIWNGVIIALSFLRLVLSRWYQKTEKSLEDYGRWEKLFMLLIGATGLTWGAVGVYLFPEHSMPHQFFIPFVLSGMVAGSLALYSSKLRVFAVFAIPVSVPVVIKFITLGGPLYYAMGSLMAVFTAVLLAASRQFRRVMLDSLKLRNENKGLVAHLTDERDRAEMLNRELHDEIEERKSTAEQLAESEEKHRMVVEKAFDAIVVAQDGIIQFANPRVSELSGYSLNDIIGKPVDFLVHPDDKERVFDYHVRRLKGEDIPDRYEFKARHKNDDTVWAETSISRIIWEGKPASINFVRSIGERKAAEALYKDKVRAEVASRAKTDFLANMSHEMRTPLNTIIGAGDLLGETSLNEEQQKYLSMLRTSGDGLLQLINEILDLSRIEAGKIEIEANVFNLHELVESTCGLFSFQAGQKGLSFRVEIDSGLPEALKGDAARLRQIIINLVGNAVKFTHEGGITVKLEVREKRKEGVDLVFSVTDTGIGIPDQKLKTVFDSFTQVDSSITREYGGSGLGLTICRNLAELMGGALTAESGEGRGSIFSLALTLEIIESEKICLLSEDTLDRTEIACAQDGSFHRVLLAEDTENNRMLIRAYLKRLPIQLDEAVNGEQAVEKVLSTGYDLVLMDIQMPVMDGWEATAEIRSRENGGGRKTPILALTANAMPEDVRRSRKAGFDGHLSKPIRKAELISALAEILPGREADADAKKN